MNTGEREQKLTKYMAKILYDYCCTGYLREPWTDADIQAFLDEEHLSLRIMVMDLCKTVSNDAIIAVGEEIAKEYPELVCKAYRTYVLCLFLQIRDLPPSQQENTDQLILEKFTELSEKATIQTNQTIHDVNLFAQVHQMIPSFQGRMTEKELRIRFLIVVKLYSYEEQLCSLILKEDFAQIRTILDEMVEIQKQLDNGSMANSFGYFSFLWRFVERFIYQKIGRHITSKEKMITDDELMACQSIEECADVIYRYIVSYATTLELTNLRDYNKAIQRVKDYVSEKYGAHVNLKSVASLFGLSVTYLGKLFKKSEGVSFNTYMTKIRMTKAKQFLDSGQYNVNEVATLVGYAQSNYFCKVFKQYWGVTPKTGAR